MRKSRQGEGNSRQPADGSAGRPDEEIRFACDAMCGGLARWLRAIGYDAAWSEGIDDSDLVEMARREGRILISSDSKIFERKVIASGEVKALFLPRGLKRLAQLEFVVSRLGLRVREPRCMSCGGRLERVRKEDVADEVPAKSLVWAHAFYRCSQCKKVFWEGSHWRHIESVRESARKLLNKTHKQDPAEPPRE